MESTTIKGDNEVRYIAFFDLDKTITKAISGRALARKAFSKGLLRGFRLLSALWYGTLYRLKLADPVTVTEKMAGWVKGLPEQAITDISAEVFMETMLPSIHPEVYEELNIHKNNNARTVILSSSITPICAAIADHLGIDDIICSSLESKDGVFTGKPVGRLCYGDEKLARIRDYCEKYNTNVSDAWYYGDSIMDAPPLGIVGNPVCISPDKKLRKIAEENHWRVYLWK